MQTRRGGSRGGDAGASATLHPKSGANSEETVQD